MTATTTQPVDAKYQALGQALAILRSKIVQGSNGKLSAENKARVAKNENLKGWDSEKASDEDTAALIAKLEPMLEAAHKEIEEAAQTAGLADDGGKAVEQLKKAQAEHGKLSDDELKAAIEKQLGELATCQGKLDSLATEANRRARVKDMTAKLNINTAMDKAILDQVIGPGNVASKTRIGGV